jgi:hypothetical protein
MSKIMVKPAEGLTVRHPESRSVLFGVLEFERTPAIIRMIKQGDLVVVDQKVAKKAPKKANKQEAE